MDKAIKEKFFAHHSNSVRLNHGSFGAVPKPVLDCKERLQKRWLAQPDEFYFNELHQKQIYSKQLLGKMLNVDPSRISLINNATTAGAIVSLKKMWDILQQSPTHTKQTPYILQFDICYPAIRKSVEAYLVRVGAELLEVKIPFPCHNGEEILTAIENILQSVPYGSVVLAFLDHISSVPSMVLPLREMVGLCRRYGVQEIFVDGAHAIGQVPLDMQEIQVEYYTSNLHKWLYAPTGCAVLYCSETVDNFLEPSSVHHVVPSFYYNRGLSQETTWAGTDDYSAQLCVPEAIRFYSLMGHIIESGDINLLDIPYHDLVRKFHLEGYDFEIHHGVARSLQQKAREISHWLSQSWCTNVIDRKEDIIGLVVIELPNEEPFKSIRDMAAAITLRHFIRKNYNLEILPFANDKGCYLRLSCQIYNTQHDFQYLRDTIAALM